MWELLKDFFLKKEAFVGYMRGGIMAMSVMGLVGVPETRQEWLAVCGVFLGGMIRAGDKNPSQPEV